MRVKKCRICGGKKFKKLFSLGKQPLANNLLGKPEQVKRYPLELIQCIQCTLIQLSYVVAKEKLYDNYLYIPSISKTHLKHFDELAKSLLEDLKIGKDSIVVDIGSSDGSLLKSFKWYGENGRPDNLNLNVVGVEPAKNIKSEIKTYREYFSVNLAKKIVKKEGRAKLVTATNSFAHIDNLKEYLKALDILLDEDGIFFAQFPDVRNLLKENQFDTIYHEHLSYFTYEPLHYLFAHSKFELFRVDESTIHGGSMRIYVRRRKSLIPDFIKNAKQVKKDLRKQVLQFKKEGKRIAGFGAAAKGMVLLDYCNLNYKLIDFIADGTPYKQGKFTPGTNIPIMPENELVYRLPEVILILAWNFKDEIMKKLDTSPHRKYIFIVPIPKVEIL